MLDRETRDLLAEALLFLSDHPRFNLRCDPRRTSYELASRIDAHLRHWDEPPHPAIAIARDRWRMTDFLRVDEGERAVSRAEDGYWVRGWIRVGLAAGGEIDPDLGKHYDAAVANLSELTRAILLAHQRDGKNYAAIAVQFDVSVTEVERRIASALLTIASALDQRSAL